MEIGSILLKKILCGKFWENEKNNKLYSKNITFYGPGV